MWRMETIGVDCRTHAKTFYIDEFFQSLNLGERFAHSSSAKMAVLSASTHLRTPLNASRYDCRADIGRSETPSTRNRSILIHDAVWIVGNQIRGRPDDEVKRMTESFRKSAVPQPDKK